MFNRPATQAQRVAVLALNRLIRSSCHPAFEWTSLQFNRNTVADPHTDKNNVGLSFVLVCGSYSGGSLCVPRRGIETPPGKSPVGIYIDGREVHLSRAYEGTRFSVVAFVHSTAWDLDASQHAELVELGFRAPAGAASSARKR